MPDILKIKQKSCKSKARTGVLRLKHGEVQTPCFLPIGTYGAVKSLTSLDVAKIGFEMILTNTYHLWERPGTEMVEKAGGTHGLMNWNKPIFTDSGGFQAFSLGGFRKFSEQGVEFQSTLNGSRRFLSPEVSMQIQTSLGSDIAVILDECLPAEVDYNRAKEAMELTLRWAKRSKEEWLKLNSDSGNFLFGIPQGAQFTDLRRESALRTMELGFDGYAIGGVANGGEPEEMMYQQVLIQTEVLEDEKPKHLLGVGTPKDIVEMVKAGIDTFDCVYPTRNARHGSLLVWKDIDKFEYETLKIFNKEFEMDFSPINIFSKLPELQTYTKASLRHFFKVKEVLGHRLATLNNLEFYFELMVKIRKKIEAGEL
jgi:queuine tRNA-ribosyltransferase